jgi:hypothetical protein
MTPTPEQLEAVRDAIVAANDEGPLAARAAWSVIAPMVLEAAAKVCEDGSNNPSDEYADCAERLRELKGELR